MATSRNDFKVSSPSPVESLILPVSAELKVSRDLCRAGTFGHFMLSSAMQKDQSARVASFSLFLISSAMQRDQRAL